MRLIVILYITLLLVLPRLHAEGEAVVPEEGSTWYGTDHDLNFYYSYVGLILDYNQQEIPDMGESSPSDIFKYLLFESGYPKNLYFEASIYPAPVLGGLLRKYSPETYFRGDWEGSLNVWEVVTTDFEEPWALTFLFGNMTRFIADSNQDDFKPGNIGFIGLVTSVGNTHIKENIFIDDWWLESELKFKGDQIFRQLKRSWSFFIGMKVHEHPEISDLLTFSVKFDSLDYRPNARFFSNVGYLYRFELSYKDWQAALHKFEINRKWIMRPGLAYSLKMAILYYAPGKYKGSLSTRRLNDEFQIALRPGIHF